MNESDFTIEVLITRLIELEDERVELVAENTRQREEVLRMIARKIATAKITPPESA